MTRRRLLRVYTIAIAVLCGGALTLVAHDAPSADAAASRTARCEAFEAHLATLHDRRVALERRLDQARRALQRLERAAPRRRRALLRALARERRAAVLRSRATVAHAVAATTVHGR